MTSSFFLPSNMNFLARGQLADVHNVVSLLHLRIPLVRPIERRAGKRHQASASRL
jgi:hypothetical protein